MNKPPRIRSRGGEGRFFLLGGGGSGPGWMTKKERKVCVSLLRKSGDGVANRGKRNSQYTQNTKEWERRCISSGTLAGWSWLETSTRENRLSAGPAGQAKRKEFCPFSLFFLFYPPLHTFTVFLFFRAVTITLLLLFVYTVFL